MKLPRGLVYLGRAFVLGLALVLTLLTQGEVASVQAGTLQSLTVSNPRCQQASTLSGACAIAIANISATGSDATFERITISINGKTRANLQGFFDSAGYLNGAMLGDELKVACGGKGAGGDPNYGNLYTVQIQANMYANSPSTDTANVYCPYYDGKVYLPDIAR